MVLVAGIALAACSRGDGAPAAQAVPTAATADPSLPLITVYKSPTCGCCSAWVGHLHENGFRVAANALPPHPYQLHLPEPMNTLQTLRFRLPLLALVLAVPIGLAACGGDSAEETTQAAQPTGDGTHEMPDGTVMDDATVMGDHDSMSGMANDTPVRMVDGVQVIEIEAGRMGYAPREVTLEAGVPARLTFTRTVDSECSSQVKIPAFGVPVTDLPMNEPVTVEFTPDASGEFTFVCGMDMQRGSLMVRS